VNRIDEPLQQIIEKGREKVAGALIAYGWYRRGTWRDSNLTEAKVDIDEAGVEMSADGD